MDSGIVKITVRDHDMVAFAALLMNGQAFDTHGYLKARRGFAGLGEYVPFDDIEREELIQAQFVVYSYDTPIAWRTQKGAWVLNGTRYNATTSRHQSKVFSAISQL